ncbi:unnamed protein product [Hyaloperonospora brassicae]|uniref:PX domain-containing protein n=1 Tax=Hyaloperonospora brassicae TaxID=162125 RepID=A0AAV0TVC9_HYABA|nr:unnamed protein product [Hyaloperonospora brassicae]
MGCACSRKSDQGLSAESLFIDVVVAKRPGRRDVGPVPIHPHTWKQRSGPSSLSSKAADGNDTTPSVPSAKLNQLPPDDLLTFSAVKTVADPDGVMFYHFCGSRADDSPSQRCYIRKRYTDFKVLHAKLAQVVVNHENETAVPQKALPAMPSALHCWSCVRQCDSEEVLKEREKQFTAMLNAIARHPVARQSAEFVRFLSGCS